MRVTRTEKEGTSSGRKRAAAARGGPLLAAFFPVRGLDPRLVRVDGDGPIGRSWGMQGAQGFRPPGGMQMQTGIRRPGMIRREPAGEGPVRSMNAVRKAHAVRSYGSIATFTGLDTNLYPCNV